MNRKQRRTFDSLLRRKKLHALPLSLFSVEDRQAVFDMFPEAWKG